MYGRHGEAPAAHRGPADAERLLRRGHRGGPHGRQVPDAGHPALRRLPGQRRRALAAARSRRAARRSTRLRLRAQPHRRGRQRRVLALRARPRDARPALGPARAARARAPHRRAGEGGRQRQRLLRGRQPRAHGPLRRDKIAGIAADIPPVEVNDETGDAQLLLVELGFDYGAVVRRGEAGPGPRHEGGPRPPAPPQPVARQPGRGPQPIHPSARARDQPGPVEPLLRAEFLVDAQTMSKMQGVPFRVGEIEAAIRRCSEGSHERVQRL